MKSRTVLVFLAACLPVLQACNSGVSRLTSGATIDQVDRRGLVIVSTIEAAKGEFSDNSTITIESLDYETHEKKVTDYLYGSRNVISGVPWEYDFTGSNVIPGARVRGKVYILNMAPGRYALTDFNSSFSVPTGSGATVYTYSNRFTSKAEFLVEEGEVLYLGSLSWFLAPDRRPVGLPKVTDEYHRDVAIAKSNVPLMKQFEVRKSLISYKDPDEDLLIAMAEYKHMSCLSLKAELFKIQKAILALDPAYDFSAVARDSTGKFSGQVSINSENAEMANWETRLTAIHVIDGDLSCRLEPSILITRGTGDPSFSSGNNQSNLDQYYGQAEAETINQTYDKNLWAKALVLAEGNTEKRVAKYIDLRARQLAGHASTNQNSTYATGQNEAENTQKVRIDGLYQAEVTSSGYYFRKKSKRTFQLEIRQIGDEVFAASNKHDLKLEGVRKGNRIDFELTQVNSISGLIGTFNGSWIVSGTGDDIYLSGKWLGKSHIGSGKFNLIKLGNL